MAELKYLQFVCAVNEKIGTTTLFDIARLVSPLGLPSAGTSKSGYNLLATSITFYFSIIFL